MTITIHHDSIEIGRQQYIEDVPIGLLDKLKDALIEHGGRNFNGTFMRHGNIGAQLLIDIIETILKYHERQKEIQNDWQSEKTANEHRVTCRDYLMQVEPADLTVEDALEALGYGRNGLKFS